MERVYNFSAGPGQLPEPVLKQAAAEMLNYQGSGMSVMEMSHRSRLFEGVIQGTEALIRELMEIPVNYSVLFLQGGASTQFAMVPLNLFGKNGKADYIDTGHWSSKAIKEAKIFGRVNVAASSKDKNYSYIPDLPPLRKDTDYVHITTNNTIYGTRYTKLPETGLVPLVADMSSNILSEPYDVTKFGLIYAGAQKNLGPAGVTLVIIRKDLLGKHRAPTPTMLRYSVHAEENSLYNTPPCYGVYIVKLVLEWLKAMGGVAAIYKINQEKAALLYNFLDNSRFFKGTVREKDRSLMNIPFVLPTEELNTKFIKEVEKKGFVNLKGHRSVGGMRASIYNAMPLEGVKKLVEFMKAFEQQNRQKE
ncbi:MAG: 3-phosphoserine/phosphohydroxythreonine transaminase [Spirochaetota bacterium]